jgi:hypothetical protein
MVLETILRNANTWSSSIPTELDSENTFVAVFGAQRADSVEALAELRAAFPRSKILGCSTAGEIFQERIYDDALVVAVAKFESVGLRLVSADARSGTSRTAGETIARRLVAPDLRAVFLVSEGLHVNGSELVTGINSILPPGVVVTGGLGADGDRFRSTWVFDGAAAQSDRVVAVGFYGDRLEISHGSKGGWDIFGPERLVTRAAGNVLYELDRKPALKLYKDYLGERAAGLPATALLFPLAVRAKGDEKKQLVRTVLSVDEKDQSLTFAGDIPVGSMAQLMRANFDRLIEGATAAAELAAESRSDGGLLAIAISCVGRRLVLGERAEEEVEAALEVLPRRARQIGFYSYGEISPFASGRCDLHNQTMTLTTFAEK